ncbi:MAG TPA: hypothetical protein VJ831_11925 [Jatrophihabitantaceae bacterium]|nr:hypothetical protein [Jatrophihabitantaceae bacterium]
MAQVVLATTSSATAGSCATQYSLPYPDPSPSPDDSDDSTQDIDNDGGTDLVVGVPAASVGGQARAGVVDIHYSRYPGSTATVQRLDESYFTGGTAPQAGDGFGSAVAFGDIDDDPQVRNFCEDLVIGMPGANNGKGQVIVAFGSPDGISPAGAIRIDGAHAGEHYGAAVAVNGHDIWVGIPDRTVNGFAHAGAVEHLVVTPGLVRHVETFTEDYPGVPGVAETGDRFGQVLAAGPGLDQTLAVGEPDEDVGRAVDAGSVTVFRFGAAHTFTTAATISQNSPGVSGTAESGDHFGAAVSLSNRFQPSDRGQGLVVGVPGEAIGTRRSAGMVHVFAFPFTGTPTQLYSISQDTPGVPGGVEAGDRFGASVLTGGFEVDALSEDIAIGSPGESFDGVSAAGTVTVVNSTRVSGGGLRTVALLFQTGGGVGRLGGTPQAGDHVGAGLSAKAEPNTFQGGFKRGGGAALVVAAPDDDISGVDSGDVAVVPLCLCQPATTYTDSAGPIAGEHYGVGASGLDNGINIVGT